MRKKMWYCWRVLLQKLQAVCFQAWDLQRNNEWFIGEVFQMCSLWVHLYHLLDSEAVFRGEGGELHWQANFLLLWRVHGKESEGPGPFSLSIPDWWTLSGLVKCSKTGLELSFLWQQPDIVFTSPFPFPPSRTMNFLWSDLPCDFLNLGKSVLSVAGFAWWLAKEMTEKLHNLKELLFFSLLPLGCSPICSPNTKTMSFN